MAQTNQPELASIPYASIATFFVLTFVIAWGILAAYIFLPEIMSGQMPNPATPISLR
ncbi:hypothetical protein KFJ24_10990 [Marinobacter sediminum]|uniref:hypothetical protein n=1 Tax=Marinobacter sediminum TaxID=256323 RepID=UPI00202E84CB|nr:hypothetical protein [Marinobacter sediminum]MCM0612997.1 hypothetical protein [Marinobacter sediminum]